MNTLFWPVMLITAGILMLIRNLGHVDIPVVRTMIVVALIWTGVSIARSGVFERGFVFGSRMNVDDDGVKYYILFDHSNIDLTQEGNQMDSIKVRCAFGSVSVLLPEDRLVHIEASGAFCSLRSPDGKALSFGEGTYDSGEGEPLFIEADCAFGKLTFDKPQANGGVGR